MDIVREPRHLHVDGLADHAQRAALFLLVHVLPEVLDDRALLQRHTREHLRANTEQSFVRSSMNLNRTEKFNEVIVASDALR